MTPSLDKEENHELIEFRHRFWWTFPLTISILLISLAKTAISVGVEFGWERFAVTYSSRQYSSQYESCNWYPASECAF